MNSKMIVFLVLVSSLGFSQSVGWEDERFVYAVQEADENWTLEILYRAGDEVSIELNEPESSYLGRFSQDLKPLGHREETSGPEGSFVTNVEIQRLPWIGNNEYLMMNIADLYVYMRNFRFVRDNKVKIRFLGQEANSDFSLEIHYIREEDIRIGSRNIRAHRVELVPILSGAMSIFGGFLPRTVMWFSRDANPYLLKFEGSSGFGGGETRILTFQSKTGI